jgi:hypothetical protein
VALAENEHGLSQRRACRLVGISRSLACRVPLRPKEHARLRERLRALAGENRRYGYRRLHELLKREGWRANHKLVARLYQEERLAIRRRHRQKRGAGRMSGHWCPIAANQRWSMDFTEDTLASGRKFRTANLKDDCTRECPAILVDFSLPGRRVTLMLDDVARERGYPDILVVDNGPEFTGRDLENWAHSTASGCSSSIPASRCRTVRSRASTVASGTNASIHTGSAASTRPAGSSSAGAWPTTKPGPTPPCACRRPKRSRRLDRSSGRGKRLRLQSCLAAHRRSRLPLFPKVSSASAS